MAARHDPNVDLLFQSALELAEVVLEEVVTEFGRSGERRRVDFLCELCSQALEYVILLETITPLAGPLIDSMSTAAIDGRGVSSVPRAPSHSDLGRAAYVSD